MSRWAANETHPAAVEVALDTVLPAHLNVRADTLRRLPRALELHHCPAHAPRLRVHLNPDRFSPAAPRDILLESGDAALSQGDTIDADLAGLLEHSPDERVV